jgi:hypothetical protein
MSDSTVHNCLASSELVVTILQKAWQSAACAVARLARAAKVSFS